VGAFCKRGGVTLQNYYKRRKQRRRAAVNVDLMIELVKAQRRIHPRMGIRKLYYLVASQLKEAGVKMGRDRMFLECKKAGFLVEPRRAKYPRTTQFRSYLPTFKNLIRNLVPTAPNQVWVADITYICTLEGYLYLALITDNYSRKIVGSNTGETLEAEGCLKALDGALEGLPKKAKPIHHSDRGCQFACHLYVDRLVRAGLTMSMTEEDHCAENAMAERVNGILKDEYWLGSEFKTKKEARQAVEQAVSTYNYLRPHCSLAMKKPAMVHQVGA
jgi:putative transposase